MQLTTNQIIELVKSQPNSSLIQRGKKYESILKVLTEPMLEEEIIKESGWDAIKETMSSVLDNEKYLKTLTFTRLPLPVTNITADISGDLNKVFESRNANFETFYPRKATQQEKGDKMLANMRIRQFIHKNGQKVFQNKPNSFVVVDKDEQGVPFLIFVTNDMLWGLDWMRDMDTLKYIMFTHSTGKTDGKTWKKIAFYDDTHYRVIRIIGSTYEVESENLHNLTYCPAVHFLNIPLNSSNPFDRFNPIAKVIATLVDWTDFDIYNRFYEHYGIFPIAEQPRPVCNDKECTDGNINSRDKEGNALTKKCPTCARSPFLGPGSIYLVDAAGRKDEQDVFGKLRYVSPPIANLVTSKEFQRERANFAKVNSTGVNSVIQKEAVNEPQVKAVMEDRRNPLLFMTKPLNALDEWIVVTSLKLGLNIDAHRNANYGTEWFLFTVDEIQKLFGNAKEVGLPEGVLDLYYKLLVETEYKNDPNTVRKLIIENNLNPAPYKNMTEAYEMSKNFVMSRESLTIKANITALVKRFERDNNESIVDFGVDEIESGRWTFADKIDSILNSFKKYIKDEQIEQEVRPDDAGKQGENQPG